MNPSDHINSIDNNASPKPRRTKRGLALLSVLWVLALLALIAASFTRTTRTEINLTRNLIGQSKAGKLAVPFGPFLSIGAITYIFFGPALIFWYWHLLR